MRTKTHPEKLQDIQPLPKQEQNQIKGGILLYCEEKRSSFLGIPYTSRRWKVANNGSLFISVQM